MIRFVVTDKGSFSMRRYLAGEGRVLADRMSVVVYSDLARMERLPVGTWVFTEPDQLDAPQRELAAHAHSRLETARDVRVMNKPKRVLLRRDLLRAAYDAGINDFRAWLASDVRLSGHAGAASDNAHTVSADALRYPVFVRYANEHMGNLTPLLDSPRSLAAAIASLVTGGARRDELLVVEFCDTKDTDGVYRKYAAYNVGGTILPKSVECSRQWMVKWNGRIFDRQRADEELHYCATNPHAAWIAETFRIAGIDYGRIDYGVESGTPRLWEINTNPTLPGGSHDPGRQRPPEFIAYRAMVADARVEFHSKFQAAWIAVDSSAGENESVSLDLPPALAKALVRSAKHRRATDRIGSLVNVVARQRWLKPVTHAVKRALAPILAAGLRVRAR